MSAEVGFNRKLHFIEVNPDSKVCGTNMGPTWVLSAPGEPHVGPINLAIRKGILIGISAVTVWLSEISRVGIQQKWEWKYIGMGVPDGSHTTNILKKQYYTKYFSNPSYPI